MSRPRSKTPLWIQSALAGAIRAGMTPPLVMGLEPALAAARGLARIYPTLQRSRFERATRNLRDAYPDWDEAKVHDYALRSYAHVFQLGVELAYAPRLITEDGFLKHLILSDIRPSLTALLSTRPCILISAHVGNWELIGYSISMLGFPMHAVYRPLDLEPFDRWVRETRARRGLGLVSKFGAVKALPPVLAAGYPVGLVADQSGGDRGIFAPFFGRLTSTYKSIGLLALQTGATLVCGMARRLREGEPFPEGPWQGTHASDAGYAARDGSPSLRYAVELVDQFGPEDWTGRPDPLFYLTARYRRAIEMMVRAAPEQYFWMHRIWRSRPAHERLGKPFPPGLREKLAALPWMTSGDVEAVVERSARDAAEVRAGRLS